MSMWTLPVHNSAMDLWSWPSLTELCPMRIGSVSRRSMAPRPPRSPPAAPPPTSTLASSAPLMNRMVGFCLLSMIRRGRLPLFSRLMKLAGDARLLMTARPASARPWPRPTPAATSFLQVSPSHRILVWIRSEASIGEALPSSGRETWTWTTPSSADTPSRPKTRVEVLFWKWVDGTSLVMTLIFKYLSFLKIFENYLTIVTFATVMWISLLRGSHNTLKGLRNRLIIADIFTDELGVLIWSN